jgi:hypothetical protein
MGDRRVMIGVRKSTRVGTTAGNELVAMGERERGKARWWVTATGAVVRWCDAGRGDGCPVGKDARFDQRCILEERGERPASCTRLSHTEHAMNE